MGKRRHDYWKMEDLGQMVFPEYETRISRLSHGQGMTAIYPNPFTFKMSNPGKVSEKLNLWERNRKF